MLQMEGLRERRIRADEERDAMRNELEAIVVHAQRVEEAAQSSQLAHSSVAAGKLYCSDG